MSKRCPDCGYVNEDSRIYCSYCGEPLDAELRLMKGLKEQSSGERKKTYKEAPARRDPTSRAFRSTFDEDDVPRRQPKKKESSAGLWIVLGVIVVAVIVLMLAT